MPRESARLCSLKDKDSRARDRDKARVRPANPLVRAAKAVRAARPRRTSRCFPRTCRARN